MLYHMSSGHVWKLHDNLRADTLQNWQVRWSKNRGRVNLNRIDSKYNPVGMLQSRRYKMLF